MPQMCKKSLNPCPVPPIHITISLLVGGEGPILSYEVPKGESVQERLGQRCLGATPCACLALQHSFRGQRKFLVKRAVYFCFGSDQDELA